MEQSTSIGRDLAQLFVDLQARHPAVAAHSRRVSKYSTALATHYGLPARMTEAIGAGALLHDVGKILLPARMIARAGRLSPLEEHELQRHPEIGLEMANRAGASEAVCRIVLYHHERHDGLGYPEGLAGSAIGWAIRIVSVMDGFDAILHGYGAHETLSVDAARALIARQAGRRFCPWVVSGLLSMPAAVLHGDREDRSDGKSVYLPEGCVRPDAVATLRPWTPELA